MLHTIRDWVTHNWLLKLFSLLLAFLLWATIVSDTSSDIRQTVRLEFQSPPPNMVITGDTTTEVEVLLRGPSSLLNQLSPSDVRAVISLAGQDAGAKTFPLSPANIRAPAGVEILRISPNQVQFNLEQFMKRALQIRHNVQGDPDEGYEVERITVIPASVEVEGPRSHIEPLESVTTSVVRIDGRTSDLQVFADLFISDQAVQLINFVRPEVLVHIVEKQEETTLELGFDPSLAEAGWQIEPESVEVTVQGPLSRMDELDAGGIYFRFDPNRVNPATQEVTPAINLDESFTVTGIEPETVHVVAHP